MSSRNIVVIAAAALALLAGCSGETSSDGPSDPPTASSAPSASSAPAGTPTPTSTVTPAAGLQLETQDALRFRAPAEGEGWVETGTNTRAVTTTSYVDVGTVTISVGEFPTRTTDLDEMAAADLATLSELEQNAGVSRQDNRVVAGRTGWVLGGKDDDYRFYTFGALHAGVFVTMNFRLPIDLDDPDGLVDSVLASVEWK